MTITSRNETPVFFDVGDEQLFGVFTTPDGPGNGMAVISLWGAGGFPTFGKNQTRARLAREFAERGFHVMRIDYRGIGDSGGETREVDFANPWLDDLLGAVRWLEARGFDRIVIATLCFGGRIALAAAEHLPGLAALALVTPPVADMSHREANSSRSLGWYLKRAASPGSLGKLLKGEKAKRRRRMLWRKLTRRAPGGRPDAPAGAASPRFLRQLDGVLAADIPVLLLYGRTDDFYPAFEQARSGRLGQILERAGALATVRVEEGAFIGMATLETQELYIDIVTSWMSSVTDGVMTGPVTGERRGLRLD